MDIKEFERLLSDFSQIKMVERKKTFMELCPYPYHRFEEICSKTWKFHQKL